MPTVEFARRSFGAAAVAAAFVLLALRAPAPAAAQTGDEPPGLGWGIRPASDIGFFEFNLAAGEAASDSLLVVNHDNAPRVLHVRPVEAVTAQRGGVAFADGPGGVSGWLDLEPADHRLNAGESVAVPFTVTVPHDAEPGEYVSGVVAVDRADLERPPGEAAAGVHVITRVGVAVIVTVPGPRTCAVQIESASAGFGPSGDFATLLEIHNAGNVGWSGSGSAQIAPATGGGPIINRDFQVGYIIAGQSAPFPLYDPAPPPGEYTLRAEVEGEAAGCGDSITAPVNLEPEAVEQAAERAAAATVTDRPASIIAPLTASPLLLLAAASGLLGFGLLGAVGLYWLTDRRRKQRRSQQRPQPSRFPEGWGRS